MVATAMVVTASPSRALLANGTGGEEARGTQLGNDVKSSTSKAGLPGQLPCALASLSLASLAWAGATHCLKATYTHVGHPQAYSAPFLTCWFCSLWTSVFFPLYIIGSSVRGCSVKGQLAESVAKFRDKGLSSGQLLCRSLLFLLLSVLTNYLYIASLDRLTCTVAAALFATNASFTYLLSWVVLHEKFMGVRIMAVLMCTTGIALLAYMDGVQDSPTLGSVVLASGAAAGSAVYKVMFKHLLGDVTPGQVSLFFSLQGLLNCSMLWPLVLLLYATGAEVVTWPSLPWPSLLGAATMSLAANMVGNLVPVSPHQSLLSLGLLLAVPLSAGYDVMEIGEEFHGMKLAGVVTICLGFLLVLTPCGWEEMLRRLVRWSRQPKHPTSTGSRPPPDTRTGHIGSRLRSPSGRVK